MKKILALLAVATVLAACGNKEKEIVKVTGVSLDKRGIAFYIGDSEKLTATVSPANADNQKVTWKSGDDQIVSVVEGVVTGVGEGDAVVTVTTVDGGKTATCAFSVSKKPVPVTGISLDQKSASLVEGTTLQLTATVEPEGADDPSFTWKSDKESVATVSDEGLVTAISVGTATITVTTTDGGKTDECVITVTAKPVSVSGVSLDKANATIKVDETVTLTATVSPADATNKEVSWKSSDETVATVKDGVVKGIKEGKATITVTTADGGKTATCEITVSNTIAVESVSLDKTSTDVAVNQTFTLTATVLPENATNKDVTWSSSDETVATVENGVVKGIKVGTATITVTTADGGKTATCVVTVKEEGSAKGTFTNEGYTEGEPFTWN